VSAASLKPRTRLEREAVARSLVPLRRRKFALFPRDGAHKPTLCVWELVPVQPEQQAWTRFLTSPRDEAGAERWMADRYAGAA
jgi:hypothetical protein